MTKIDPCPTCGALPCDQTDRDASLKQDDGAEGMREACAKVADEAAKFHRWAQADATLDYKKTMHKCAADSAEEIASGIRALPIPTKPDEPVVDGFVMVPRVPTEAMLSRAFPWFTAWTHMRSTDRKNALANAWSAMIDAATTSNAGAGE